MSDSISQRTQSAEVQVWRVAVSGESARTGLSSGVLSVAELERAARFYRDSDRDRYVCAHAALRGILGSLLNAEPCDLEFVTGDAGKPALAGSGAPAVEFNLSHSGDVVLIAVGSGRPVGVDVERVSARPDLPALADRFFSKGEADRIRAVPQLARTQAFLRVWTRKEAYVKACGVGLSAPLNSFEVLVEESDELFEVRTAAGASSGIWARSIDAGPGYCAAVAALGGAWKTITRTWPESPTA